MNRTLATGLAGAVAGTLAAVIALAMSAGLVVDGGAGFIAVSESSGRGTITAGTDATYLYVLLFGLIGGWTIAFFTAAIARWWRPEEPRFRPAPIAAVGAVAGAIVAYAVMRAGIGLGGSIVNEVVTISAFRAVVTALVAGAAAGAAVSITADRLSQPANLGLAGEAWPATKGSFLKETMPAMLIPILAVGLVAVAVVGMGQGLVAVAEALHDPNAPAAVIIASGISALILGGAAFIAYRGGKPSA